MDNVRRQTGGAGRLLSSGGFIFLLVCGAAYVTYTQFRIDVPFEHMAILISKEGLDIPNDEEIAPSEKYKGVQRKVLTEGRYFENPFYYDWEIIPYVNIKEGELGVKISLTGENLPYGEFIAKYDEKSKTWTKGIVAEVLKPGRHPINPYEFAVEIHKPVIIQAGYKGVVTNLSGDFPEKENTLLVQEGERGVQEKTKDPGKYYINPYVTRISQVDCRSQRFDLAKNKDMGFPSRDGFWISLDGSIEFRVNPEQAAEVFVTYNENDNGDDIDAEIISKVILPNARSFCRLEGSNNSGREFISGETRTKFQEKFQTDMQEACEPLGIEIIQALIAEIKPPEPIAEPVREKELAKLQNTEYLQQIEEQKEEQKQATEKELVSQKQALVKADQAVVVVTIEAEQQQQVDVTKAEERKSVAQFKLDAAKDEAEAILAKGKAEAEVIGFQNEAEAAGWKRAVEAFSGDGSQYARYVLYQKMAVAYREIMVNTADSPIMKIFESFAPGNIPQEARTLPAKTAGPVQPAAPETETNTTAEKSK